MGDLNGCEHQAVVARQLGHTVEENPNVSAETGLGRRKKAVNSLGFALGNLAASKCSDELTCPG